MLHNNYFYPVLSRQADQIKQPLEATGLSEVLTCFRRSNAATAGAAPTRKLI